MAAGHGRGKPSSTRLGMPESLCCRTTRRRPVALPHLVVKPSAATVLLIFGISDELPAELAEDPDHRRSNGGPRPYLCGQQLSSLAPWKQPVFRIAIAHRSGLNSSPSSRQYIGATFSQ